jgi:ATP-dependent Clp protease ATP-binding subunit ClpC
MFIPFSARAKRVMILARDEAELHHHDYIGPEHILLGILDDGDGIAITILQQSGLSIGQLRIEIERYLPHSLEALIVNDIPHTPRSKKVLGYAHEEAELLGLDFVETEHLLLGLLKENENIAAKVLNNLGIHLIATREKIVNLLSEPATTTKEKMKIPGVDEFGCDLTALAKDGKLDSVIGREREIERVIQILCRHTQNNPVLIGEPGTGKTAIIDGLAQRIVNREVPQILLDKRIVALNSASLPAGMKYSPALEVNISILIKEIEGANGIIFIDKLQTSESMIYFNELKSLLMRGEIQCITTARMDDYQTFLAGNRALTNLFQMVIVGPTSEEDTIKILMKQRDRFEKHYRMKITNNAIVAAVQLSDLFMPERFQPEKSLNLIDDVCSSVLTHGMVDIEEQDLDCAVSHQCKEGKFRTERKLDYEEGRDVQNQEELMVETAEVIRVVSQLTGLSAEAIRNHDTSSLTYSITQNGLSLPDYERLQCESILPGQNVEITPGLGFVLIPHEPEFDGILNDVIRPAMAANNIEAIIADDIRTPGAVLSQVWNCIRTAEVIVADISGSNPNVIYELGLCFGLHRFPLILTRDPSNELPFNLRALRFIDYEDTASGAAKLRKELTEAIAAFRSATRRARPSI